MKIKSFYNSRINVPFVFLNDRILQTGIYLFFQNILTAIRTFKLQLNYTKCLKLDALQWTELQQGLRLAGTSGNGLVQPPCSKGAQLEQASQGHVPFVFLISPSMDTSQPLWATCSSIWPPSHWNLFPQCLNGISCISVCIQYLSPCTEKTCLPTGKLFSKGHNTRIKVIKSAHHQHFAYVMKSAISILLQCLY